jgi:hypothetical protein
MKTPSRVAAGLGGLAAIPFLLTGVAWIIVEIDLLGDHADVAWLLFLAGVDGLIGAAMVAAFSVAFTGRLPLWRRLAFVPVGAVVIVATLTEPWWTG